MTFDKNVGVGTEERTDDRKGECVLLFALVCVIVRANVAADTSSKFQHIKTKNTIRYIMSGRTKSIVIAY